MKAIIHISTSPRCAMGRSPLYTTPESRVCCLDAFKNARRFCFLAPARVFLRRFLIDDQNGRRFIYCLSGNQIILCCRSLGGSTLINSLLLQTQGAGRGLLIKERTSETVNKLGSDSTGDAQSVPGCRRRSGTSAVAGASLRRFCCFYLVDER